VFYRDAAVAVEPFRLVIASSIVLFRLNCHTCGATRFIEPDKNPRLEQCCGSMMTPAKNHVYASQLLVEP
jgi:hypothetical protein